MPDTSILNTGNARAAKSFSESFALTSLIRLRPEGTLLMTQLMRTAAYVRRKPTDGNVPDARPVNKVDRAIWQHLQTPNTVDSLTRAITDQLGMASGKAVVEVEMVLQRFLAEDLIELSSDS